MKYVNDASNTKFNNKKLKQMIDYIKKLPPLPLSLPLILCLVAIFSGCATTYQKSGLTGGYSDSNPSFSNYVVQFSGNGYTNAQRASDFAFLRLAELCIRDGFNYFIVLDNNDSVSTSTVSSYSYNSYSGVGMGFTIPVYKPNTTLASRFFVASPRTKLNIYNAKEVVLMLSQKYNLDITFTKGKLTGHKEAIRDYVRKAEKLTPVSKPDSEIQIWTDPPGGPYQLITSLGSYDDFFVDSPQTEAEFLKELAVELGADTVVITKDFSNFQEDQNEVLLSKVGYTFLIRIPVKLGIAYESGLLKEDIYQIRSFSPDSKANLHGLMIGDRLIALDGIDIRDPKNNQAYVDKSPGDFIVVTITRGTEQMDLRVPLIQAAR